MSWKYTDATNRVVSRTLEGGSIESCLVEVIADWIAQGNTPAAADTPSLDQLWEKIKAERDRRTETGGYKVGTKWFHSDQKSRSQQLGLVLLGANIPAGTQWKTMDGSFVTMTATLAGQILASAAATAQAAFSVAETHKSAMEVSPDPAAYDFSGGWPQTYAESLLQA